MVLSNAAIEFDWALPSVETQLREIEGLPAPRNDVLMPEFVRRAQENFLRIEGLWSKMSPEEKQPFLDRWSKVTRSLRSLTSPPSPRDIVGRPVDVVVEVVFD